MIPNLHGRALARSRVAWPLAAAAALVLAASAAAEPVTLAQALARAAAADPGAGAADARIVASEANLRQAGVRPNPTVGAELENFASTGGLSQTEATVYYQQTVERGGKRDARSGLARAQTQTARLKRDVRRLDLLRDVQVAYAEALAAEVQAMVAESRLAAAREAQADIDRRVRSARDPLFAGARAETQTAQAVIARDQALAAADAARAVLTTYWGGDDKVELDPTSFFAVAAPRPGDWPADNADLALLAAERDAAEAAVRLEQARGVVDPTLRAGLRYLGAGRDVAFVVGGSIPLRRYDTNRGAIERAQSERTAAEIDIAAARVARDREIARLLARLQAQASESDRIAGEVIPAAQRTVDLVREGFNRGGFQYIDVTEAQRALVEARARRVEVLRQFHLDQAAFDRLTARHEPLAVRTAQAETPR